ncbi:acetylornithine deacetylase [Polyplosphaeria fusca]|uniref:Probable succinyl-diaminopimelate desuccinylase n=1 Tax=Polyplosphaeria fusca TaxID=682080 RepID=A0A9P4QUW3_9PLEO|nr:acetylornithine deacetylase [Polyplosphaeria fusca]
MSAFRRPVYFNPAARSWSATPSGNASEVDKFHRQLPGYHQTPLVEIPKLAQELNAKAVYVKDESSRFGLPSFKILGASWGAYKALVRHLDLPVGTDIKKVKEILKKRPVALFAATDGNHGRAVARMGSMFGIAVQIHVPNGLDESTAELIRGEGARVIESLFDYDVAVLEAHRAAQDEGGLLIQDYAFDGYEDVPQWIVDGYSTMMREVDEQLGSIHANIIVAPVGVGSFAQSVVAHFKTDGNATAVIAVEPDAAPCLWRSLEQSIRAEQISTYPTILAGLNCGTVSKSAWHLLSAGVDASLTISDFEAHNATRDLQALGISAGPCGAASLAGLRRLSTEHRSRLGLTSDAVVVLFCTEGYRPYDAPANVALDDPVSLTQTLVSINSVNPGLDSNAVAGETTIAQYIAAWLQHRDIETHWIEPTKGRPSIVGVVRGSGEGKSLMFNGHIDTVAVVGYDGDPFSGKIKDGRLYARGSADMKAGIAAAMIALANSKRLKLRGDVIFAGVADEEANSIGTEELLKAGWRADGALVSEPSNLDIVNAHKGFVWLEVDIHGVAAHGSRFDLGVDAIAKAGYFLVELDKYSRRLQQDTADKSPADIPSVHASIIKGGVEASTYPASCTITIERRTIPGETVENVKQELLEVLGKAQEKTPDFKFDLRATFNRSSFNQSMKHPFAETVRNAAADTLGREPLIRKELAWTDSALLAESDIPVLVYGPLGEGYHAKEEWVDVDSIQKVTSTLTQVARNFCT